MSQPAITVVGAGLAGLAVAEALLSRGVQVTLLDEVGVAAGASGAATGLLHPFPGLKALLPWKGLEAFALAVDRVQICAQEEQAVILARGVWRPATAPQRAAFLRAAHDPKSSGLSQWCEQGPPVAMPPEIASRGGLWVEEGLVVDVPRYLTVWWQDLLRRGLHWEKRRWEGPVGSEVTVLASGAHVGRLLGLELVRGQSLLIEAPSCQPPLSCGVSGRAYIAPKGRGWWVGATFEHGAPHTEPEPEAARALLRPRVNEVWQGERELLDRPLLEVKVGLRVSAPGHLPVVGRWRNDTWVVAGLGSKGLLYHVYVAELLARALLNGCPVPKEVQLHGVEA